MTSTRDNLSLTSALSIRHTLLYSSLLSLVLLSSGCTVWDTPAWVPWTTEVDRTSYLTASKRIDATEELARGVRRADEASQQQVVSELARQIQNESDPHVREAILRSAAKFDLPLAEKILIAGTRDQDQFVRMVACRELGKRPTSEAISALGNVLRTDDEFDVRVASVDALGETSSPQAIATLATAIYDSDPAMQFAGTIALAKVADVSHGRDVGKWREYVAAQAPDAVLAAQETEVESR